MPKNLDFDEIQEAYAKKSWHLKDFEVIKSGKDASVYKVNANDQIAALKIYHSEKKHSVNYYLDYSNIQKFPPSLRRAIKSGNKVGKQMLQKVRVFQEYKMLDTFYSQGVALPEPFDTALDTVLMELIGNDEKIAPELNQVALTEAEAANALDTILDSMEQMLSVDMVHGDLSEFNILWWQSTPYIIDFPQAINIREHSSPKEFFLRDLQNVCNYFQKYLDFSVEDIWPDFESYFDFL